MAHLMCGRAHRGTADRTGRRLPRPGERVHPVDQKRGRAVHTPPGCPASSEITWRDTETPARSSKTAASQYLRTAAFGQPGTARTVSCIHPAPVAPLPGHVTVEPLQRRPDHRALMPAARHDLPANRLSGPAQRLPHHRGLIVPGPPPQKMDTADADAYLGMVARWTSVSCDLGWPQHQHLLWPAWSVAA